MAEMIVRPLESETVADQGGRCVGPWTLTIYLPRGGDTMGKTSKAAPKKKAAVKPKGPVGKSVKKK